MKTQGKYEGHIPGPWYHSCDEGGLCCNVNTVKTGSFVEFPEGEGWCPTAALIAAAPDLLAENIRLRDLLDRIINAECACENSSWQGCDRCSAIADAEALDT